MLPGIPPTGRRVEIPLVAIVHFRGDKLVHEHIYWDQASVLVQIGCLDPAGLPVAGRRNSTKGGGPDPPQQHADAELADQRRQIPGLTRRRRLVGPGPSANPRREIVPVTAWEQLAFRGRSCLQHRTAIRGYIGFLIDYLSDGHSAARALRPMRPRHDGGSPRMISPPPNLTAARRAQGTSLRVAACIGALALLAACASQGPGPVRLRRRRAMPLTPAATTRRPAHPRIRGDPISARPPSGSTCRTLGFVVMRVELGGNEISTAS